MRAALARHDAIVERAIAAHGGVWFKRVGDAVQAAFHTAPDALAAAVDAQRALATADWGPDGPLAVRMAVHAGEAAPHRGDYVAPCLNRLARLMAAGYGGQILLSQAVALLVRDHLPSGVALQSLGAHRLRDLLAPEEVHQAVVDDLPAAFPALKTLDAHPHNLPQALTPLIDRAAEVAEVHALLDRPDARLVTLTGPGGIGKSRLALQLAAEALDDFPDGAFFVPLAAIDDPALVLPALAAALGVAEGGSTPLAEVLTARLAERRTLLVLDNLEQIVAVGPDLAALLEACPSLRLIVTSRAPLRVRGEHEVALGPLALPAADDDLDDLDRLPDAAAGSARGLDADAVAAVAASPAVMLFVDRARATDADFALTADNAAAVEAICRRLDGVPLAIELAAARVRMLPPAALLARLEGRLAELGGARRDLPARQQTLAATLDWSHALLGPDERRLFRRLAVFRGGWTIELAESICAAPVDPETSPLDVFTSLTALVDMSLVQPAPAGDSARFTLFQVVIEYAADLLAAAGEAEAVADRHAAALAAMADAGRQHVVGGEQALWLERLAAEHANLRAALDHLIARGQADAAVAMAADLWRYWYLRGHLQEGQAYLRRALSNPAAGRASNARARAMNGLGVLTWLRGDFAAARAALGEARALAEACGDDALALRIVHNLGLVAVDEGDLDAAADAARLNLVVARRLGDRYAEAGVLHGLGIVTAERGDMAEARDHFAAALAIQRELDDREGMAATLINLAGIDADARDLAAAEAWLDEARPLAEAVEDIWTLATIHHTRGDIRLAQGDLAAARAELGAAARLRLDAGDPRGLSRVLPPLGRLALAEGNPIAAARLFGAAAGLRHRIGAHLTPREVPKCDADTASVVAALGADAAAAAVAEGEALSADDAVALATAPPT